MGKKSQKKSDSKSSSGHKTVVTNRQARFHYQLEDGFEAGMVLTGSEVKSLRAGKVNLTDAYVEVRQGEAYLLQANIDPYEKGGYANHEPKRRRKLLLNRHEIDKIMGKTQIQGLSVVPLKIYFKSGRAKVEIALAKGKKVHDKRQSLKEKSVKREMERAMKHGRG